VDPIFSPITIDDSMLKSMKEVIAKWSGK